MPPGNSRLRMRSVVNLQNENDRSGFPTCLQPEVHTMKIASRVLKVLSLLTALAACGRSQSNTSTGATLQGMVASSTAAAQGLRVGVDSASMATTTDAGGHF